MTYTTLLLCSHFMNSVQGTQKGFLNQRQVFLQKAVSVGFSVIYPAPHTRCKAFPSPATSTQRGYMTCLNRSGTSNLREINCQQTVCSIMYVSSIAIWLCSYGGAQQIDRLCVSGTYSDRDKGHTCTHRYLRLITIRSEVA